MIKFIFCLVMASSLSHAQDQRLADHLKAERYLSELNFFHKGRGMAITPNLVQFYSLASTLGIATGDTGLLNARWGLTLQNNKAKGIFNVPYEGMKMGVLGCVACHSGKAAGVYIIGLGNKNIDVGQIGKDASKIMGVWGAIPRLNPKFREVHNRAMKFTKGLADDRITNETQGLVSVAIIREWFYQVQNVPTPNDGYKGQVKVPHWWGYGEKRKSGLFWDGDANGLLGGWPIAVELFAGQTAQGVRELLPKIHETQEHFANLLPPKYPFKVEKLKAEAGKKLFESTCWKCHGDHDRDLYGYPVYEEPQRVDWAIVQTDKERLNILNEDWYNIVDRSPLNDIIQYNRNVPGYVAPKLWGVWSRFPYLHNASVPTVYDLLSEPKSRPKVFSLKNAGERERFDENRLGLTPVYSDSVPRRLYDTRRFGHSNQGHYYESFKKLSHENKLELIEYLKTL